MTNRLSSTEVTDYLASIPLSRIFTVIFIKQDGNIRSMTCRRGVTKYLKGGESTIAEHKNLISVFDMQKKQYRCFDTRRVISIK